MTAATDLFERNKARYERTRKIFIDVKAGIGHLAEKLEPIKLENETGGVEMSDDNIEEILDKCELKLSRLMSIVHRLEDPSNRDALTVDDEAYEEKLLGKSQSDIRIRLNENDQDDGDDGDDFEDEDEDVCNRKHVKYNSEQILER